MFRNKLFKKILIYTGISGLLIVLFTSLIQLYTSFSIFDKIEELPKTHRVAVVLGAKLDKKGRPQVYLKDRLDAALQLYCEGKVDAIMLSGEKKNENFNEIDAMEKYILDAGIPLKDTYLDTGGVDTYSTVYRMKHIFQFDQVILVSQKYHLSRAVFLGKLMHLDCVGFNADKHTYKDLGKQEFREVLANVKAALDLSKDRAADIVVKAHEVELQDSLNGKDTIKPASQK